MERKGASYRISQSRAGGEPGDQPTIASQSQRLSPHWKAIQGHSGPMGEVTARMAANDRGTSLAAWSGAAGHHAEVEAEVPVALGGLRSGLEHNRYVAGPFRTQFRAQVAAESLANRVENESGHEKYENSSWFESRRRY